MLHERVDSVYKKGHHELTGMQQLAEQLVRYDLDDLDVCWLEEVNFSRREMGVCDRVVWYFNAHPAASGMRFFPQFSEIRVFWEWKTAKSCFCVCVCVVG